MRPVRPAVLPDHELAFTRKSAVRKGGVLDIRPRPGHAVEGVLMAVSRAGWRLLDIKEGVHFGAYEPVTARVVDFAGTWHDITTYRVVPRRASRYVPPHEHYVAVCAEGLRWHGLDPGRLMDAAAGRPARSPADGVFLSEPLFATMAPHCAMMNVTHWCRPRYPPLCTKPARCGGVTPGAIQAASSCRPKRWRI